MDLSRFCFNEFHFSSSPTRCFICWSSQFIWSLLLPLLFLLLPAILEQCLRVPVMSQDMLHQEVDNKRTKKHTFHRDFDSKPVKKMCREWEKFEMKMLTRLKSRSMIKILKDRGKKKKKRAIKYWSRGDSDAEFNLLRNVRKMILSFGAKWDRREI